MGGTSAVLCRYYLHGACKFGSECAFSHSMEKSESQVCRFYQLGACSYGEKCRYMHTKPDWGQRAAAAGSSSSSSSRSTYAPPAASRPAADDLADQLPISRLRLGGQATEGSSSGSSSRHSMPATVAAAPNSSSLPLPVQLPQNPFGGGQTSSGGGAARTAERAATGQQQQEEEQQQGAAQQQAWQDEQHYEGEQYGDDEYWEEGGYYDEEGQLWLEAADDTSQEHSGGSHAWPADYHQSPQPPEGGSDEQQQPWSLPAGADGSSEEERLWAGSGHPSLRSLCMQYFSTGSCNKAACSLVHGELCQHCHKHALHPADLAAREQHLAECRQRHERLSARARSAGIECSICLEPVLGQAAPEDRKFGLLTGCDHPFCLRCIRSWRQKTDAGADIDTALRTCPVCRTTSHYIVPSLVWPIDREEKERIVAGYKTKLSTIDCRLFNYGQGTCPFSTSCFYRHAYEDGRLEESSLRKAADEEGNIKVMQPVRLSDFITISSAGRRLGLGGRRR